MEDVEGVMKQAREQCSFDHKALHHHHRPFPALAAGVSFGSGQAIPGNLAHSGVNRKALRKLLRHPSFTCISNFANGAFATWFLRMYQYYHKTLRALYAQDETLECLFPGSAWPAMSLNFGPATWCY